jgi:hypothetical protein
MDTAASGYDLALPLTAAAPASTPEALSVFSDPRRAPATGSAAGRLAAGASMASAAAELSALSRQFRSAALLPAVNIVTLGTGTCRS